MVITCVAYLHGAGGAERQITMLSNAMAERGHEVHLIVLAENKSKYYISDKVVIHDLTNIEHRFGNAILNRYLALKKELKEIKTEILVHFWLQSAYLSVCMPKSIRGKMIYAERGDPGDSEYDGILGFIRTLAFRKVDGFVFQSEGARDYFDSRITEKSIVIHNAVSVPDKAYIDPCKKREKRIINVGRLHNQKNQKLLIDAFALIASSFPKFHLEIYGDGMLKESLENQIKEYNLEDQISIFPSTNNIYDRMYSSSLFVLSSDFEGMPNALLEAMALGVPCISTDCRPGGARTLIENGINGWLVPINNVQLLSEQMKLVLNDMGNAEIIARQAMKIRTLNSSERIYNIWNNFFNRIVKAE